MPIQIRTSLAEPETGETGIAEMFIVSCSVMPLCVALGSIAACAAAVAAVLNDKAGRRVIIHLRGGDLEIEWRAEDNHVYMTGPAEEVFEGTIEV